MIGFALLVLVPALLAVVVQGRPDMFKNKRRAGWILISYMLIAGLVTMFVGRG